MKKRLSSQDFPQHDPRESRLRDWQRSLDRSPGGDRRGLGTPPRSGGAKPLVSEEIKWGVGWWPKAPDGEVHPGQPAAMIRFREDP